MFGTSRRSLKTTLAINTIAQIVARGVSALTSFIITIIIARQFGANGFGDFIKITTYVAFFYLLADFGFNAIFLQQKARWETLVVLRIIAAFLLVAAAVAGLLILPKGTTQGYTNIVRLGILLFTPSILFQALITSGNALFQKYLRYELSTVAVIVGSIVTVGCMVYALWFYFNSATILWATTAVLVGSGATAGAALLLTRKLEHTGHLTVSRVSLWRLFRASVPLGLTLLFNLVYFRVDSIILTLTRSTSEVGIYGLAYKIFEIPLIFPTFFMNALYPIIVQETRDKRHVISKTFKHIVFQSAGFLFVSSLIVSVGLWICAPIVTFIKSDFTSGIMPLRVLSLGLPFFFLSSLTMWILVAQKKQKVLAGIYGISMAVNVCLNYFFVPTYGYMAAAWITVASEALVLFMTGYYATRYVIRDT
jgi:O-antigen/teichoic acid export membrane protein